MTRRIYKIGESVWVKEMKKVGKITELNIKPEEETYKAVVDVKLDEDTTVSKTLNLWDIDKTIGNRHKEGTRSYNIPIKYFDDSIEKIEIIEKGDWIDLRARERVEIKAMDFALIPLNVAMKLPKNYEANIVPRSSTYKKWGIIQSNHFGVVDNSYSGNDDEWLFPAIALRDTVIEKGDRICQFKIVEKMDKRKFNFKEVEELYGENRGGFGSTGSN